MRATDATLSERKEDVGDGLMLGHLRHQGEALHVERKVAELLAAARQPLRPEIGGCPARASLEPTWRSTAQRPPGMVMATIPAAFAVIPRSVAAQRPRRNFSGRVVLGSS